MNIEQIKVGAVTILRPNGAVSQDDAEVFHQSLAETQKQTFGRFVIDFSAVSFLDSRALEALVDVTESLADVGRSLKIAGETELLRHVFEVTELTDLLEHYQDVNAAVRSFL